MCLKGRFRWGAPREDSDDGLKGRFQWSASREDSEDLLQGKNQMRCPKERPMWGSPRKKMRCLKGRLRSCAPREDTGEVPQGRTDEVPQGKMRCRKGRLRWGAPEEVPNGKAQLMCPKERCVAQREDSDALFWEEIKCTMGRLRYLWKRWGAQRKTQMRYPKGRLRWGALREDLDEVPKWKTDEVP